MIDRVRRAVRRRAPRILLGSPALNPPHVWWNPSHGRSLDQPANAKLVVVGLPKSGNVWLRALLQDYLALPPVEPVRDVRKRGIGITHLPLSRSLRRRADFVHVAYIFRDVRDVVVSYFHYAQTEHFRAARPEFHYDDVDAFYYEWFVSRMVPAYRWHTHADEWAAAGVPVVRYERLWDAPERELARLVRRLGLEVDDAKIAAAVDANRIERLRRSGKQADKFVPQSHFRVGGYGGYARELPDHVLADIEVRFAGLLRRWGYQVPGTTDAGRDLGPIVDRAEGG